VNGWRDDARRTIAQDAIAAARLRLACVLEHNDAGEWSTVCPRCRQTTSGGFRQVEDWATQHACADKEGQ